MERVMICFVTYKLGQSEQSFTLLSGIHYSQGFFCPGPIYCIPLFFNSAVFTFMECAQIYKSHNLYCCAHKKSILFVRMYNQMKMLMKMVHNVLLSNRNIHTSCITFFQIITKYIVNINMCKNSPKFKQSETG